MQNKQEKVTINELAKNINKELRECKSEPDWKFSSNNCSDLRSAASAHVLNPRHIVLSCDEVHSVPKVIRDIVMRQYELAHKGKSNIIVMDVVVEDTVLEAAAA